MLHNIHFKCSILQNLLRGNSKLLRGVCQTSARPRSLKGTLTVVHKQASDIIKKNSFSNNTVQIRTDEKAQGVEDTLCSYLKHLCFLFNLKSQLCQEMKLYFFHTFGSQRKNTFAKNYYVINICKLIPKSSYK